MKGAVRDIVVVGPGALGCLLAANLSRVRSAPLWLLDHDPERAVVVQQQGLILETGDRQEHFPVLATAAPQRIGPVDLVLLTVKSTAVPASLPGLAPLLGKQSLLLAFQNGIGHLAALRSAKLPGSWGLAVTTLGATLLAPGRVRFGGAGQTSLGCLPVAEGVDRLALQPVAELFDEAGMSASVCEGPEILSRVWNKLLANVGINALTAIHDCPNGGLLERPAAMKLLRAAVEEAAAVARAQGIVITPDPVGWVVSVCRATANNLSSMLQDVRRQRRTEIDAINGAVLAEAMRLGLPAAANRELLQAVKAMERSYLGDFP